jgi:ribonuclease VapC
MVIEGAVLLAILRDEPDGPALQRAILADRVRLVSAVAKLDAAMAAVGLGDPAAADDLDDLVAELQVSIVPFDDTQSALATDAFSRFGRGRHRASFDLSACATYALAIAEGEKVLARGGAGGLGGGAQFAETGIGMVALSA